MEQRPVCLSVGGSDSCSGAGIQADLRMFNDQNVIACSAITALTAQNPREITRIEPVALAQLDAELHSIFDYYEVAAVKTGMLLDADHIAVLAAALQQRHAQGILVIDPVMISSSGRRLLDAPAVETLLKALVPMATLITPNLDEAEVLLGRPVVDAPSDCRELVEQCGCAVLLKGGHGAGDILQDVLSDTDGNTSTFEHPRLEWSETEAHGSGCRLASAITSYLAKGEGIHQAVGSAIKFCSPDK